MILVILAIGFVAAGLTIGLAVTAAAPLGYEDKTGFHFGRQHGRQIEHREEMSSQLASTAARLNPHPV
jgi:hypothetical protein